MTRRRLLILGAFGATYLIWGSTYLAIKVGLESLPPFVLMGVRSFVAGAALYAWARARGAPVPGRSQWRAAAIVGVLLFVGGHGGLAWSEQHVPSGVASLVLGTTPIWMSLLYWRTSGVAPSARVWLGLAFGLSGVGLLAEPWSAFTSQPGDRGGLLILLGASLAWAIGAIRARQPDLPDGSALSAGMALLTGGAVLLAIAGLTGQTSSLPLMSAQSAAALVYLIVAGSIVAFGAYVWLLRVSTPVRVSTSAYVNPVVALALGSMFGGEPLSPRVLVAAAVLLTGVAAIVSGPDRAAATVRPSSRPQVASLPATQVREAS